MLGLPQFCLKIPKPGQHAIGVGKIPILAAVLIFLYNCHNNYITAVTDHTRPTEQKVLTKTSVFMDVNHLRLFTENAKI